MMNNNLNIKMTRGVVTEYNQNKSMVVLVADNSPKFEEMVTDF